MEPFKCIIITGVIEALIVVFCATQGEREKTKKGKEQVRKLLELKANVECGQVGWRQRFFYMFL